MDANGQPKTTPALVGPNPLISDLTNRIKRRDGSSEQYQYDDAGNLIVDGEGSSFKYDSENRQVEYYAPGASAPTAVYTYDAQGRRVKKLFGGENTIFVYDAPGQLVAEYSNAAPVGGGTRYVTSDMLGSPRVITDKDGVPLDRQDYLPFGEEINDSFEGRGSVQGYGSRQSRQRFTGYEFDGESRLSFAQARFYANVAGRFTTVDPLLSSASLSNPQRFNRYAYCGNNPINCTDPSGLDWFYNPGQNTALGTWNIAHPVWFEPGQEKPLSESA